MQLTVKRRLIISRDDPFLLQSIERKKKPLGNSDRGGGSAIIAIHDNEPECLGYSYNEPRVLVLQISLN